jgi:cystathionine beta-lyase/cystathionine gamma-synthase
MGAADMNPTCEAEAITLRAWAEVAKPGERRIYFTGFLARSSGMAALASVAMELQEAGAVHLLQQRLGDEVYAYIAQRRR